uniref:Peptidase S1 domain-containing protein n=1 Tax=Timema monikensis TaxID=170555 RepID=A0A7R9EKX8_9NEOP|nr:unnamed protein product [Timema monikensis]
MNRATCVIGVRGDSGGPLQVLTEENSDVYSVVGITSFGPATCGGGPAVYTKVASFIPWIEKIVWP